MVFMRACYESMYPDYIEQGAYINYRRVKADMNRIKEMNAAVTPDDVYLELTAEIARVFEWCRGKIGEINHLAQRAVEEADRATTSDSAKAPQQSTDEIRRTADSLLFELLRFQECRNLNLDIIVQIHRVASALHCSHPLPQVVCCATRARLPQPSYRRRALLDFSVVLLRKARQRCTSRETSWGRGLAGV